MRLDPRRWSIRTRTAATFALVSMALTAAVLVFVNVTALVSVSTALDETQTVAEAAEHAPALPMAPTGSSAGDESSLAIVRVVATNQWGWSAVGVLGAGLLAGVVGWYVSRRMLRPVDAISATTARISASTLHERIDLAGPDDELRRLARTVDGLLGRLESSFDAQRRFVAQASHELRTPLAVQRAAIQIGLQDGVDTADVAAVRDELLAQNRRTEHLVESLLVLADAERGIGDRATPIDLASLVDDVVVGVREATRTAGVTLAAETGAAPPGRVRGEPTLLRQLVANLVDNAVEYNEPGGFVRVRIDARGLVVENSGPVVPERSVASLAEPFVRCASASDGPPGARQDGARRHSARRHSARRHSARRHSGLGLSIVAAIAAAHGWRLSIVARPGGGLRVRVDVSPV
jgi:signal transduction histidine kinase